MAAMRAAQCVARRMRGGGYGNSGGSAAVMAGVGMRVSSVKCTMGGGRGGCMVARCTKPQMTPDVEKAMGARDPTKGELESGFATKVQVCSLLCMCINRQYAK